MKKKFIDLEGSNLFCFFPGENWGTSKDNITMVIAHWDTVANSPGFDDNGSGMAAMIEIARALGDFFSCLFIFTLALDRTSDVTGFKKSG